MPKSRSQKDSERAEHYKTAEAQKLGLAGGNGVHGASRNPYTGLDFKLPGHQTMDLAVEADRQMGYVAVQRGEGMASYEKGDPRLQMGSTTAPRDTDISGAVVNSETLRAIEKGNAPRTDAARKKREKEKP